MSASLRCLKGIALSALISVFSPAAASALTDPLANVALWMTTNAGVVKIDRDTGQFVVQVAETSKPRVTAVDEKRALVWVYAKGMLYAYSFGGQLISTITVPPSQIDDDASDDDESVQHLRILVDVNAETLWLVRNKSLYRFTALGAFVGVSSLSQTIQGIALDHRQSRLWIATKNTVTAYDVNGAALGTLDLGSKPDVRDIAYDLELNQLWVAQKKSLRRYDVANLLVFDLALENVERIASDQHKNLWLVFENKLARIQDTGLIQVQLAPFQGA